MAESGPVNEMRLCHLKNFIIEHLAIGLLQEFIIYDEVLLLIRSGLRGVVA